MNYSFSLPRLWQLILKQGMENGRFYLLYILATMGVLALVMAFWVSTASNSYKEEDFYFVALVALYLCGSLFASLQFDALSRKDKGIYWLSFPASHLEKLVCAVFYTFIVFNILFVACFLLFKWLVASYIIISLRPEGASWTPRESPFSQTSAFIFIYIFIALQAFYMLGSVYFARYSFVKTTVTAAVLIFGFALFMEMYPKYMFGPGYTFHGQSIREMIPERVGSIHFFKVYSLPDRLMEPVSWLLKYSWAPAFWIITWKRLGEKEI